MKSSWFPISVIIALLGLLVLLATLQYQWLGQISDAEKTRLEERLIDDAQRFAQDFNNEIQNTHFYFQLTTDDWATFPKRFELWQKKAKYKDLVDGFYYIKATENPDVSKFDTKSGTFERAVLTDELREIYKSIDKNKLSKTISGDGFSIIIPIKKSENKKGLLTKSQKVITVTDMSGELIREDIVGPESIREKANKLIKNLGISPNIGHLIIKLNKKTIKNELLPNITDKYFSETNGGSYKVSITDKKNKTVFQTHDESLNSSDVTVDFYNLNNGGLYFFERGRDIPVISELSKDKVVFKKSVSSTSIFTDKSKNKKNESLELNIINESEPKLVVKDTVINEHSGIWTLKVQHIDGSLDQFITNTRQKNLAISFGILSLLAVSIILIFISSQRAKSLAQKQMDFVSSVSHEFRTPLAVIYSASENLSDGVIEEQEKISSYGNLIKREGKKLSAMVEQILEFAGANSGKRKYDFRNVEISKVIYDAVAECQQALNEKDFAFETEFKHSIKNVFADEKALTLALQNLINNSLKYSNGTKWLKLSTENDNENLIIKVEDKGIGISEKDRKQIFEPFFRAKKVVDEQISGNGLGLNLVKQIIEAHRGKISVESKLGEGSLFILSIPLNK